MMKDHVLSSGDTAWLVRDSWGDSPLYQLQLPYIFPFLQYLPFETHPRLPSMAGA